MLNFLIALLSNTLATVLKDKRVVMEVQRLAVIIAMDYVFFIPGIESISRLYYSWMVPKYFIVENKRVYLIRTVVANENK